MWQFFWDTFGFVADNVSRNLKLLLFSLLLITVFFFFGLNGMFYFAGGIFWIAAVFLVVANLLVRARRARAKSKEAAPAQLTVADQADIAEFQQAMEQQPARQEFSQGTYTPHVRKAAPPPDLPNE